MVLPTDRQTGDIIDAEDINDIAEAVNLLEAGGGGGGGTTNHSLLTNRDAADQHPISAITGLQTALNAKADSSTVNTALSGKANSSHTHAAGDITSGVLSTTRLPAASTTAVGIVELATNAEAMGGTVTDRAVTPAALRAAGDQRYVRTVNGTGPDMSGNVLVSGGGGGGFAIGSVYLEVNRNTSSASLTASSFTTYPFNNIVTNLGGGSYNTSTFIYTIPENGLYLCLGSIRLADSATSRNTAIGIGTSNDDAPFVLWGHLGGGRSGRQYLRLARFNSGNLVRLFIYSEGITFDTKWDAGQGRADGQYMSILKVGD